MNKSTGITIDTKKIKNFLEHFQKKIFKIICKNKILYLK